MGAIRRDRCISKLRFSTNDPPFAAHRSRVGPTPARSNTDSLLCSRSVGPYRNQSSSHTAPSTTRIGCVTRPLRAGPPQHSPSPIANVAPCTAHMSF